MIVFRVLVMAPLCLEVSKTQIKKKCKLNLKFLFMFSLVVHSESTFACTCLVAKFTKVSSVLDMLRLHVFGHILVAAGCVVTLETAPDGRQRARHPSHLRPNYAVQICRGKKHISVKVYSRLVISFRASKFLGSDGSQNPENSGRTACNAHSRKY